MIHKNMNKRISGKQWLPLLATGLLLSVSCNKNSLPGESGNILGNVNALKANNLSTFTATDTILNVDYESGTTDSGIPNLPGSDATAADAAYMIQPGATGSYAVAHKVVYGDSAYFADGNWRSETSTRNVAKFYPGEERRYEFSVLLKDWADWVSPQPATRSNIFQCRVSGPYYVPVMVRIQRNSLQLRRVDSSAVTLVSDIRPYMNQWINVRIDVLWSMDNTGYIKSYTKLPGQTSYTLNSTLSNIRTFTGDTTVTGGGKFGYSKWGVYSVPTGTTGIAYHDNVRIIALDNQTNAVNLANSDPTAKSKISYRKEPTVGK